MTLGNRSNFENCKGKGQWLIDWFGEQSDLQHTTNAVIDKALEDYDGYLVENSVCPRCYEDLDEYNISCHSKCGWRMD